VADKFRISCKILLSRNKDEVYGQTNTNKIANEYLCYDSRVSNGTY